MRAIIQHATPIASDDLRLETITVLQSLDIEAPYLVKFEVGAYRDGIRVALIFMGPLRFDGQGAFKAFRRTETSTVTTQLPPNGRNDVAHLSRAIEQLAANWVRRSIRVGQAK